MPERRVIIGTATPAGLAGGLVQHDVARPARQANRRGEPGKPGADDMARTGLCTGHLSEGMAIAQTVAGENAMAGRATMRWRGGVEAALPSKPTRIAR